LWYWICLYWIPLNLKLVFYEPKDGILYGTTNVFVTIPEAYIGSIKVKYAWDGKMYKAEFAVFEANPYRHKVD
jgi:hypothetical protein